MKKEKKHGIKKQERSRSSHPVKALVWIKVGKAKQDVKNAEEVLTKQYQSQIARLGKSYAQRWTEITNITPENAWTKISSSIDKILKDPDNEDTSALDVFIPALTRVVYERSSDHDMPMSFNFFARYYKAANDFPYCWEIMAKEKIIKLTNAPFAWPAEAPLNVKERKPLLKSLFFKLNDENILDLYEAMAPYLK